MRGDIRFGGGRWMIGPARFALPSAVFETSILAEVVDVLDRAEQAANAGHWVVGFVSYQAAPGLDADLRVPGVAGLPLVWFGVYDVRLAGVPDGSGLYRLGEWTYRMTRSVHAAKVEAIRRAIIDGDTYQANLTFPITIEFGGSTDALFSTMVSAQPDSYAVHIDTGSAQVLSASPELFLKKDGRRVISRPMKGTAPRGRFGAEDQKQAHQLASSEKERAGNVMIVDMIRNDLGRVAESGSVRVVRLCEPERYRRPLRLPRRRRYHLRLDSRRRI